MSAEVENDVFLVGEVSAHVREIMSRQDLNPFVRREHIVVPRTSPEQFNEHRRDTERVSAE